MPKHRIRSFLADAIACACLMAIVAMLAIALPLLVQP